MRPRIWGVPTEQPPLLRIITTEPFGGMREKRRTAAQDCTRALTRGRRLRRGTPRTRSRRWDVRTDRHRDAGPLLLPGSLSDRASAGARWHSSAQRSGRAPSRFRPSLLSCRTLTAVWTPGAPDAGKTLKLSKASNVARHREVRGDGGLEVGGAARLDVVILVVARVSAFALERGSASDVFPSITFLLHDPPPKDMSSQSKRSRTTRISITRAFAFSTAASELSATAKPSAEKLPAATYHRTLG